MIRQPGAADLAPADAVCVNCRTRFLLSTKLTIRGIFSLARPFGPGEQLPLSSHYGRNVPCPCGSGKKYKRCCLAADEPREILPARIRRAEKRLSDAIASWAEQEFGPSLVGAAMLEFFSSFSRGEPFPGIADDGSAFTAWFLYSWLPRDLLERTTPEERERNTPGLDPSRLPERPLALTWLDEVVNGRVRVEGIGSFEVGLVRAIAAEPASFYSVEEVQPGRALGLRCVMTKRRVWVTDRQASEQVVPDEILFTRVVTVEDVQVLVGCGLWIFSAEGMAKLQQLRDELAGRGRFLSQERLLECAYTLREAFFDLLRRASAPKAMEGEELGPTGLGSDADRSSGTAGGTLRWVTVDLRNFEPSA
jgi:hypothetical protein